MREEVQPDEPAGPRRGRPRKARSEDDSAQESRGEVEQREEELPEAHGPMPVAAEEPGEEDAEEREACQVDLHRIAISMESRAQVVLRTLIDMYVSLKSEGLRVQQLHGNRAAEFRGRPRTWCREREIVQTWTAGDKPQSNGRAEKAIRVRTLLLAVVGEEWWPIALRNVNEQ